MIQLRDHGKKEDDGKQEQISAPDFKLSTEGCDSAVPTKTVKADGVSSGSAIRLQQDLTAARICLSTGADCVEMQA